MKKCHRCGEKISFAWDYELKKWIKVEPYVKDAGERQLSRNRQPIPYDPRRHTRHICTKKENYDNVYRG